MYSRNEQSGKVPLKLYFVILILPQADQALLIDSIISTDLTMCFEKIPTGECY